MNPIKKLAGQTVIYGLSSIVPRLLNYILVPLHTNIFSTDVYGIVTELYAYVIFLNVLLTYGMETTFFRFNESEKDKSTVYSNALISIISTSVLFVMMVFLFQTNIAGYLDYNAHPEYIIWFALIIGFDAISSIPFVHLRAQNKALKFSLYKIINVLINILANVFFLIICPKVFGNQHIPFLYDPSIGVGYVFISNLLASAFTFILLIPEMRIPFKFDMKMYKSMLVYSMPLLFAGFAGSINEALDRVLQKHLIPEGMNAMSQIGIYGANVKLAVMMTLFIQTFRFAAEPFFFKYAKEKNSPKVFADVMKYFVIFGLFIFLAIMSNIDIFQYFEGEAFREGLKIVPLLLLANLFLGIYFNLSIWYKLTNKTMWGFYITVIGAAVTILLNILFVPHYGYIASAWARIACYLSMTVVCYYLGQKYYFIPYNVSAIFKYIAIAIVAYAIMALLPVNSTILRLIINNSIMIALLYYILKTEDLLRLIPLKIKSK